MTSSENPWKWLIEDKNGGYHLRTDYKDSLSTAIKVAVDLTEACRLQRRGRIYVLAPHRIATDEQAKEELWRAVKRVPELFYTDEAWSDEEADLWDQMEQRTKLKRITARCGWVDIRVPVLPFSVYLDSQEVARPRFALEPVAPVTVYFGPKPFVGLTAKMKVGAHIGVNQRSVLKQIICTAPASKKRHPFQDWSVQGLRGVVDRMQEMYWQVSEGSPSHLTVLYQSLLHEFTQAAAELSREVGTKVTPLRS